MKPMAGLDPHLVANLETFARLEAPASFEVLLCLASERDPAFPVALQFARAHPHRFRVCIGSDPALRNPKLAQLAHAWPLLRNEFVWISESNVETSQAFFEALATEWKRANAKGRVKTLVHAPLVCVGGQGVGAALERMHVASLQNASHELALLLGLHAVVGKTEFFHKDDLEALGGLAAFGNYLGEDYLLGEAFARVGVVRCLPIATRNVVGALPLRAWFDRHARWAVMRKTLVGPAFYLLEPLPHLAWPTLLWAAGLVPASVLAALLCVRVFIDGANWSLHAREWPRPTDLLVVPLKEALLFLAWLRACFAWRVTWRADADLLLGPRSLILATAAPASPASRGAASLRRALGLGG